MEPWREFALQLETPAGSNDRPYRLAALDHEQGRQLLNTEPLHQFRPVVNRNPQKPEGVVVMPILQRLGEERLGSTTAAATDGMEEQQPRSLVGFCEQLSRHLLRTSLHPPSER